MTTTYSVFDISCDHCVSVISTAVEPVSGVTGVAVDLDTKAVTVDGEFDDAAVRATIDDAGYDIAG